MTKKICIIKGDGIGKEVIDAALQVLDAAGFNANYKYAEAGYECYKKNKTSIPDATIETCRNSDATLFGAVTTPPNIDNYKSAIITLRQRLDLFANVRPIKSLPIADSRKNIDLTIVRENTEGMYSGIEIVEKDRVIAHRIISRKASERIIRYAFEYAKKNNKKTVTLVHKANILRKSDGLFRQVGLEIAEKYPKIQLQEMIVDAMAMHLVKDPENFEVLVTTNLFGDILSDEASALVGGLGIAASANIGEKTGIFEPVHGSAPDIAGKGIANPTAAILSAAMMLDYLGERKIADMIKNAIHKTLSKKYYTKDLNGKLTTKQFTEKVINNL